MLRLHPLFCRRARARLRSLRPLKICSLSVDSPEPFFEGSEVESRRWSREYRNLLIREELASLERVQDSESRAPRPPGFPISSVHPFSVNALREDLQLSHKTVEKWVRILERLYAVFRLPPFGAPGIRAVKKARKHYHFDWSLVTDPAARFENSWPRTFSSGCIFARTPKGWTSSSASFGIRTTARSTSSSSTRDVPILMVECKVSDTKTWIGASVTSNDVSLVRARPGSSHLDRGPRNASPWTGYIPSGPPHSTSFRRSVLNPRAPQHPSYSARGCGWAGN